MLHYSSNEECLSRESGSPEWGLGICSTAYDMTTDHITSNGALVHSLGCCYRLHVRSLPGTPDLVFPRLRKIISVNGCFWHMHGCSRCRVPSSRRTYWVAKMERNAARDKRSQRELRRAGWRVMVIWECQIGRSPQSRLRRRIAIFLEKNAKPNQRGN